MIGGQVMKSLNAPLCLPALLDSRGILASWFPFVLNRHT